MTKSDFAFVCNERTVHPGIALENEAVKELLKRRKGKCSVTTQLMLAAVLREEF
jgi:hypothetical protein